MGFQNYSRYWVSIIAVNVMVWGSITTVIITAYVMVWGSIITAIITANVMVWGFTIPALKIWIVNQKVNLVMYQAILKKLSFKDLREDSL